MRFYYKTISLHLFVKFLLRLSFLVTIVLVFANKSLSQTIFTEDWESGIGSWYADNGLWDVGVPTVGPDSTYSGQNCAGTILNGNYTPNANTRLISPNITLPSISTGEHLKLKFWNWFRINENVTVGNDKGYVQISVNNGLWQTLTDPFEGYSLSWTQGYVDLSNYADSTVRIAFYFTSNSSHEDNGWYIDDVSITAGTPEFNNPENFESGIGDWNADNGLWEFGIPTVGPDSTHSGQYCIGTIMNGNYTPDSHTRLISPYITLPLIISGEHIKLKFWYWFRINENVTVGNDKGYVQISVNNGLWQTLTDPFEGYSLSWTQGYVDLSNYADSTVRIAFYFTSNSSHEDNGWYIDDVSITAGTPEFNNPENFESGIGDWNADNGLWEFGIPTVGPDSTHSGQYCIGTIMNGNYTPDSHTRLVSPNITLNPIPGSFIELYYWNWFRINENVTVGNDKGYVQISVNNGSWQDLAGPFEGYSPTWTQGYVDLSNYADSTVRIGFYFTSNSSHEDNGWYIDDVRIEGIITSITDDQNEIPAEFSLSQNYPNPFNPTTSIRYAIPKPGFVTLKVYDVLGREVTTLVNAEKSAGSYEINFDASELTSGIYFYSVSAGSFTETKKMVLLK